MTYTPDKIRNIAIVGHQGSGKTSLVESLAYKSQLIKIKGTIENKNTILIIFQMKRKSSLLYHLQLFHLLIMVIN